MVRIGVGIEIAEHRHVEASEYLLLAVVLENPAYRGLVAEVHQSLRWNPSRGDRIIGMSQVNKPCQGQAQAGGRRLLDGESHLPGMDSLVLQVELIPNVARSGVH